jgi:RNA polymerase sigma-70 factor (ECF subfamily)
MIELIKSDNELIESFVLGNKKSFGLLYRRYCRPVLSLAYEKTGNYQLAEDITQDVFIGVMENIRMFDRSKQFISWLFGAVQYNVIDYYRHEAIVRKHEDVCEYENSNSNQSTCMGVGEYGPDKVLRLKRMRKLIHEAVKTLSLEQRYVFLQRNIRGASFKEIAKNTNVNRNTCLGRMRLANLHLTKRLKRVKEESLV